MWESREEKAAEELENICLQISIFPPPDFHFLFSRFPFSLLQISIFSPQISISNTFIEREKTIYICVVRFKNYVENHQCWFDQPRIMRTTTYLV